MSICSFEQWHSFHHSGSVHHHSGGILPVESPFLFKVSVLPRWFEQPSLSLRTVGCQWSYWPEMNGQNVLIPAGHLRTTAFPCQRESEARAQLKSGAGGTRKKILPPWRLQLWPGALYFQVVSTCIRSPAHVHVEHELTVFWPSRERESRMETATWQVGGVTQLQCSNSSFGLW